MYYVCCLSESSVYPSVQGKSLYREVRQPSSHDTKINVIKMTGVFVSYSRAKKHVTVLLIYAKCRKIGKHIPENRFDISCKL